MKGYCNLCNRETTLTRDHVPPKGSTILRNVFLQTLTQRVDKVANHQARKIYADEDSQKYLLKTKISQDGVKFPSICSECNNERLGARYDREIIRISKEVGRLVRASTRKRLILPDEITISVRTHYLLRGIIGHLLAAFRSTDPSRPHPSLQDGFYKDLRDYFLDESLPIPPSVTFYYWTYPSYVQVTVIGLALGLYDGKAWMVGDLLKFFPLAYYVAHRGDGGLELPVPQIIGDSCNDMDCRIPLFVKLRDIPPVTWPEIPDAMHYTLAPDPLSVIATPKALAMKKHRHLLRTGNGGATNFRGSR
jgi:hypothetical protein